ncbi:MAG: AAA family ATPase [Candidatus Cloacimonetes bacterium]|nr:AAA family ATPase [Candidatus Cloacimonadota bacterium]
MNKEILADPKIFGENITKTSVLETHISWVVLTGTFAYKIKKPVNFGFLDFSTLAKRKYFCDEELRLNRRLAPNIYVDVVPIFNTLGGLRIGDQEGEIVDYAVKMIQFDQERLMSNLLKNNFIRNQDITNIVKILTTFYGSLSSNSEIQKFGDISTITTNTEENFDQTENVIGKTISKETFDHIKEITRNFIKARGSLFLKRMKEGHIKDCHGDLHSGNIVIDKDGYITIFDCIEFNERFRYSDVAADIGFLAMDLDHQNFPSYSAYLIHEYMRRSNDLSLLEVLNFYKCYRAYVRGKVIGFMLSSDLDKKTENKIITKANKYFKLSSYYADLFSCTLDINRKPILFLMHGLAGTGKSTIAHKISTDYNAIEIGTDVVRKKMAGINKYQHQYDEYGKGLYSSEKTDDTYREVMNEAETFLKEGKNCILNGTFLQKEHQDWARNLAQKYNAKMIIIHCVCDEEDIKARFAERAVEKSVSDGRWEIYLKQKKEYSPLQGDDISIEINTSDNSYNHRMSYYKKVFALVKKA